ncbi:MAG: glycosyltransferase family 4 protein [bacterium]
MKLIYIATSVIPAHKANAKQVMKMGQAFQQSGIEVELIIPVRFGRVRLKADPFEYYGVKEKFKITKIFSFDLIPWEKQIGHLGFWLQNISFVFFTAVYLLFKKYDLIYTRDDFSLFGLSFFTEKICWEAHNFPKKIRWFHRVLYKRVKQMVVISKGLKDAFVKQGISPEKILVAPDGVDLNEFDLAMAPAEARKQLDLPLDKRLIGYVGSLRTRQEEKGVDGLIESMKFLADNSLLVLVGGEKDDIDFYRQLSEQAGVTDRILFVGQVVPRLVPIYQRAFDVLIMPFPKLPHYEFCMSPLKLFEYLASERPIITTDLPSIREILSDREAVFVLPGRPKALADGIAKVLADPTQALVMAKNGRQLAEQYTWQKRAKTIIDFIKI